VTTVIIALLILIYYLIFRLRERKMTRMMRRSNDRLSLILKTGHVTMWTYNILTKTFTWMDDQGHAQRSSKIDEFVHRYRPEDVEQVKQALNDIATQKIKDANMNSRVYEDGPERSEHNYTLSLSVLRRNKNGMPTTILCTRSDITNELLRQIKVKDTMLRYQAIFQTVMIDMIFYNEKGFIVDMNQKSLNALGMTVEQLRARKFHIKDVLGIENFDFEHMDNLYVTQLFKSPDDPRLLNQILKRKKLYYELQIVPIHDAKGKLLGLYGSGRNVTEIADSYQALEKNVEELQQANNKISRYIRNIDYVLTVGGLRIVKYDPETHMLNIFSEANRIQTTLTQSRILNFVDNQYKKKVERILNNMDNQSPSNIHADIKTTIRGKNNQAIHLQFHFIPYHDKTGRVKEYFGMCRDISELKRIEEKLAQETLRAQEVEVVKNAFLHNMSFEIRTPLNTVVGFAELFQMEHSAEDEIVFIKEIKDNSAKLLKLINDILFLSRLDADMITMKPRPSDVAGTFEMKCESIWGKIKKPGVNYIVKNPFRKLVVDIDEPNATIILEKALTNAVEHTTSGSVMVRYDYIGDQIIAAIDDTGSGIPKNALAHIFERFVTGDGNNSKAGLGLSICHDLIEHMGGTINIKSTVGKGTSVWFSIPCRAIESDRI
jgi:PAS domain S-box-containing protein